MNNIVHNIPLYLSFLGCFHRYTMTKSTCIIFILAFSLSFGLEQKRPSLIVVVCLIGAGLFLFTYQSTQFNLEGFLLVLSASALAGLRWTLAQLVMQRKDLGTFYNSLFRIRDQNENYCSTHASLSCGLRIHGPQPHLLSPQMALCYDGFIRTPGRAAIDYKH